MFLLLNGSFGIGKTTAAYALVREVAGAAIYDPEHVGFALRRLPSWMLGAWSSQTTIRTRLNGDS